MGVQRLFSTHSEESREAALCGGACGQQRLAAPNPDPDNFEIEKTAQRGSYVCALVNYPDSTNFEGRKIIVFENANEVEIQDLEKLDPHFLEGGNIVARIIPDEDGWEKALLVASLFNLKDQRDSSL